MQAVFLETLIDRLYRFETGGHPSLQSYVNGLVHHILESVEKVDDLLCRLILELHRLDRYHAYGRPVI